MRSEFKQKRFISQKPKNPKNFCMVFKNGDNAIIYGIFAIFSMILQISLIFYIYSGVISIISKIIDNKIFLPIFSSLIPRFKFNFPFCRNL